MTTDGADVVPACLARVTAEEWLLAAHPAPDQARTEWRERGIALLPLGTPFSAVRIPGRLVEAAAGTDDPREVDAFLEDALEGGAVICSPHGLRYYTLVAASGPDTWHTATGDGLPLGLDWLGRDTYLGVPRLDAMGATGRALASYWAVPLVSAGALCSPPDLARLVAAGVRRLGDAYGPRK